MARKNVNTDIPTRSLICGLKAPAGRGLPYKDVAHITGVPRKTCNDIYNRAVSRGFNLYQMPLVITKAHVADASGTGRPAKRTLEVIQKVTKAILRDRFG